MSLYKVPYPRWCVVGSCGPSRSPGPELFSMLDCRDLDRGRGAGRPWWTLPLKNQAPERFWTCRNTRRIQIERWLIVDCVSLCDCLMHKYIERLINWFDLTGNKNFILHSLIQWYRHLTTLYFAALQSSSSVWLTAESIYLKSRSPRGRDLNKLQRHHQNSIVQPHQWEKQKADLILHVSYWSKNTICISLRIKSCWNKSFFWGIIEEVSMEGNFPGHWTVKCSSVLKKMSLKARKWFVSEEEASVLVADERHNGIIWPRDFIKPTLFFIAPHLLTSCCSLQILHSHIGLVLLLLEIPHLLHMCCKKR